MRLRIQPDALTKRERQIVDLLFRLEPASVGGVIAQFSKNPHIRLAIVYAMLLVASQVLVPLQAAAQRGNEVEPTDIVSYCSALAKPEQKSVALASVCEFALSMRKKLPDVICDQETRRYWSTDYQWGSPQMHSDVITAKVSYRDGEEYHENVRLNGKAAGDAALQASTGSWSFGEFATILDGIFAASSKAEFRYETQEKLHSTPVLVFAFHISAESNKTYFLDGGNGRVWFPEYHGKLWVDEKTFELLSLERETAYMRQRSIHRIKTNIDYSNIRLKDGTNLTLPTHADVLTCSAPWYGSFDDCSRNVINFTNWEKFFARTKIIPNSGE